jgi:hypothetical protein
VNRQQAKEILAQYRPGTADKEDPAFREARQLAETDPELARWFDEHCEAYLILRGKFRAIPIPPRLKERILAERKIQRPLFQRYWTSLLAVAAVVALLVGLDAAFRPHRPLTGQYAAYRQRMAETALRSYYMALTATDPVQIRNFLNAKKAPADYTLPAGLNTAPVVGCVVTHWHGDPVSMICFNSGRPLLPGARSDLWLFVTERKTVPNAPSPGAPVFARASQATTASWSDDKKNYLLAAVGDEAFLGKYLH